MVVVVVVAKPQDAREIGRMVWGGAFMKLRATNNPVIFFSFSAPLHANYTISPTLLDFEDLVHSVV